MRVSAVPVEGVRDRIWGGYIARRSRVLSRARSATPSQDSRIGADLRVDDLPGLREAEIVGYVLTSWPRE